MQGTWRIVLAVLGALASLATGYGSGRSLAMANDISAALRGYLEGANGSQPVGIDGETAYAAKELARFYEREGYRPLWVSDQGPTERAHALSAFIGKADRHGLSRHDYHDVSISRLLDRPFSDRPPQLRAQELAWIDILLSDAFVNMAYHLGRGKVDPIVIYPHWLKDNEKKPEVFELLAGIRSDQDPSPALEALAPSSPGYRGAMAEAMRLRQVIASGGWPFIPPGETLRRGDHSPRIVPLRKRLSFEGFRQKPGTGTDEAFFDRELERAVIRFQRQHGLAPDGVVGRMTLAELNRSPRELLETVRVNLERWRWLPRDLGRRHIIVNSAGFFLEAWEEGRKVLEMPIIVGESYTQTPVFSQEMAYLVFNPSWNVPHEVLIRKILPKIRKDPAYLRKHHFVLIKGWKEPLVVVNPDSVDWSKVRPERLPGRLVQEPGPWNALGRIKFMFPNRFGVYLHDTPERDLFKRTTRAFSSGCIRVQDPIGLAEFALKNNPSWDRERILHVLSDGKTIAVPVQDDIMVHLVYWTFWIGEGGEPHYSPDIYDRDGVLLKALQAAPEKGWATTPSPLPKADPHAGG